MGNADRHMLELDIRGQVCPSTLLIALKELNIHREELKNGTLELVLKTNNRDATITIPDAAMNMGYGVSVTKETDYYVIVIMAGDAG